MSDTIIDTPSPLDIPSPLAAPGDPGYDPAVASKAVNPQDDLTNAYMGTMENIAGLQGQQADLEKHRADMAAEEAKKIKELEDSVHPYVAPTISKHAVMAAGVIGVIGMIGSKHMGLGAQGSMNALNSAIKGAMEGRQSLVDQSLNEYKINLDKMKSDMKMVHDYYKTIIDDDTKSIQEKTNDIKVAAQMFKDYGMYTRQSYQDQVGWLNKLKSADGEISKLRIQNEKLLRQIGTLQSGGKDAFSSWSPEQKEFWFQQALLGNTPNFGYGKTAAESRGQFNREFAEWNTKQGRGGAEAATKTASAKSIKKSMDIQEKSLGMMQGFVNNLNAQVDRVEQIAKDVQRTDARILNVPIRSWKRYVSGSPEESKLMMYTTEISNEIGKLSTGSQASVRELSAEAQEKWDKIHDPNLSLNDLISVMKETKHAANLRIQGSESALGTTQSRLKGVYSDPSKKEELKNKYGLEE